MTKTSGCHHTQISTKISDTDYPLQSTSVGDTHDEIIGGAVGVLDDAPIQLLLEIRCTTAVSRELEQLPTCQTENVDADVPYLTNTHQVFGEITATRNLGHSPS